MISFLLYAFVLEDNPLNFYVVNVYWINKSELLTTAFYFDKKCFILTINEVRVENKIKYWGLCHFLTWYIKIYAVLSSWIPSLQVR